MTTKAFYLGYGPANDVSGQLGALFYFYDSTVSSGATACTSLGVDQTSTAVGIAASFAAAVNAYSSTNYGGVPDSAEWLVAPMGASSKAFSNPTRALDSAFRPSTVSDTLGVYSVSVACSLSLTGGQQGSIVLEYADDSGFTTNVKTTAQLTNGNTGALTIGLNTLQTYGGVLSGVIPMGKWARLRSVNTTGTPTKSSVNAQEIQF